MVYHITPCHNITCFIAPWVARGRHALPARPCCMCVPGYCVYSTCHVAICVRVCAYDVHMHNCVYIQYTYIDIHTYTYMHRHTCIHAYMHTCIHAYIHI